MWICIWLIAWMAPILYASHHSQGILSHSLMLGWTIALALAKGMLPTWHNQRWEKFLCTVTWSLAPYWNHENMWELVCWGNVRAISRRAESSLCWTPFTNRPPQNLQPTRDRCLRESCWDQLSQTHINKNARPITELGDKN